MSELITPGEIQNILVSVQVVDANRILSEGRIIIVWPVRIASGYDVSYSIDIMPDYPIRHLSVGHKETKNKLDPADAEHIARSILGNEYIVLGKMFNQNNIHFFTCEKEYFEDLKTKMENMKKRFKIT